MNRKTWPITIGDRCNIGFNPGIIAIGVEWSRPFYPKRSIDLTIRIGPFAILWLAKPPKEAKQ